MEKKKMVGMMVLVLLMVNIAETITEEIKQGVSGAAMQDDADDSDSGFHGIPKFVGLEYANPILAAKDMMDKAGYVASSTKDEINSAVSEASNYASKKAREGSNIAFEEASDGINNANQKLSMVRDVALDQVNNRREAMDYGKDKAANAYDQASQNFDMASNVASNKTKGAKESMEGDMWYVRDDMANAYEEYAAGVVNDGNDKASNAYNDAKEMAAGSMGCGGDRVAKAYNEAKNKVEETYASAKETMNEEAKAKYEAAKEQASRAVGDLGANMRGKSEEL